MIGVSHSAEEAFIGGLLHDIGKVILDQYQPAIYGPIVKYANDKGILILDAEREVMGLTHATVGEWLTEKWRLPQTLVNMVGNHHSPNRIMDRRETIAAIHLGDIFARALGIGNGGDNRMPEIDPTVASNYNIDVKFFETIIPRIINEIGKASDFFALVSGNP